MLLSSPITDEKNLINYLKLRDSNVGTFESKHGVSISPTLNLYVTAKHKAFSEKEELNSILSTNSHSRISEVSRHLTFLCGCVYTCPL